MDVSRPTPIPSDDANLAVFHNTQGVETQALIIRMARHRVVLEIGNPFLVLQASEVLKGFKIFLNGTVVYEGKGVISSLVSTGNITLVEVTLENSWLEPALTSFMGAGTPLSNGFNQFLNRWQKLYKLLPEYKLITADLETFLVDLRLWLEQVDLSIGSSPKAERVHKERELMGHVLASVRLTLKSMFERFEEIAGRVEPELQPAHALFCRRHLHPLLLCSPFMHRIYTKPLGYAGDYEMVNMILRDPLEGDSIFAKVLNGFILSQTPAVAHRNRVAYLTQKMREETNRVAQGRKRARIFSLGCGPAKEVQDFLAQDALCEHAEFTLLDANEETLLHTQSALDGLKKKYGRATPIRLVRRSIQHFLKNGGRLKNGAPTYDFIYCGGLLDYLSDRISKSLLSSLYEQLSPGGLLASTNVEPGNPIRNIMEFIFEWHLIYRNRQELIALSPDRLSPESRSILAEGTGSNIILEIRKPRGTA